MALYLKSLAPHEAPDRPAPTVSPAESSLLMRLGRTVYDQQCASCHGTDGHGMPPHYPPLAGNQSIQMPSAVNAIRMVLNGGYPPATAGNPEPVRHAALRADPGRRRGRCRRQLHPSRPGVIAAARWLPARPTSCAAPRWTEGPHDRDRAVRAGTGPPQIGSAAIGAVAVAGIATALVIAIWFAFYFLVFVPRAPVP